MNNNTNSLLKALVALALVVFIATLASYVYYLEQLRVSNPCAVCEHEFGFKCAPPIMFYIGQNPSILNMTKFNLTEYENNLTTPITKE